MTTKPQVPDEIVTAVRQRVAANPGISLESLINNVASRDQLSTMIAHDVIYVDLGEARLTEPGKVRVFSDVATARAHAILSKIPNGRLGPAPEITIAVNEPVDWDGRRCIILNLGKTAISLRDEQANLLDIPIEQFYALIRQGKVTGLTPPVQALTSEIQLRISRASPKDFAAANRRYAIVAARLAG